MTTFDDSTPRESYVIQGKTFQVPQPFAEGHPLSAGEANQLNQVLAENVRNNFAKKVAEADEAGSFDQGVFQGKLDDYVQSYEFGARVGGGRSDPVQVAAMDIARDRVRKQIRKRNMNISDYTGAEISELARQAIGKFPEIMELAKARVEAEKDLPDDEDMDIPAPAPKEAPATGDAPAEAPPETAPTTGRGKQAAAAPEEQPVE